MWRGKKGSAKKKWQRPMGRGEKGGTERSAADWGRARGAAPTWRVLSMKTSCRH